jgi:hypothetical protein
MLYLLLLNKRGESKSGQNTIKRLKSVENSFKDWNMGIKKAHYLR